MAQGSAQGGNCPASPLWEGLGRKRGTGWGRRGAVSPSPVGQRPFHSPPPPTAVCAAYSQGRPPSPARFLTFSLFQMSLFRYARNRGREGKAGSGWFDSQLVDSLDQAVRTSSAAELGPEWGREPGLQARHRVQAGLREPLGARSSPEGAALAGPPVCLETLSSVYRPEAARALPCGRTASVGPGLLAALTCHCPSG